ncbi:MAG: DUF2341 domain-containing protein, partial [Candidatus Parvarchaeota archaeon]|nr:DUF2341 domain-containing protein [Candidatus Jingweiarchaeum tengchongense]MCW1300118.1 DUF2341 domain-containing protein [Candidatus Jingweiarchaeum tengchongense]
MYSHHKKFILLALIVVWLFLSIGPSFATFNYRTEININNSGSSELTNYTISISFDTPTYISQGKLRNDCGDIRFTDCSSFNPNDWPYKYPYWIENCSNTSGTNSTIYIKIDRIPANSVKTIYMFFGNSSYLKEDNMSNVFLFAEDGTGSGGMTAYGYNGTNCTYNLSSIDGQLINGIYCSTYGYASAERYKYIDKNMDNLEVVARMRYSHSVSTGYINLTHSMYIYLYSYSSQNSIDIGPGICFSGGGYSNDGYFYYGVSTYCSTTSYPPDSRDWNKVIIRTNSTHVYMNFMGLSSSTVYFPGRYKLYSIRLKEGEGYFTGNITTWIDWIYIREINPNVSITLGKVEVLNTSCSVLCVGKTDGFYKCLQAGSCGCYNNRGTPTLVPYNSSYYCYNCYAYDVDSTSSYCTSYAGASSWAIGGSPCLGSPPAQDGRYSSYGCNSYCCGDDTDEYKINSSVINSTPFQNFNPYTDRYGCCNLTTGCVWNNSCYFSNIYYMNMVGDAVCMTYGSNSYWIHADDNSSACAATCINKYYKENWRNTFIYVYCSRNNWASGGEITEVPYAIGSRCCGDDDNEIITISELFNSTNFNSFIPGDMVACCNSTSKCAYNDKCYQNLSIINDALCYNNFSKNYSIVFNYSGEGSFWIHPDDYEWACSLYGQIKGIPTYWNMPNVRYPYCCGDDEGEYPITLISNNTNFESFRIPSFTSCCAQPYSCSYENEQIPNCYPNGTRYP